jgi:hypothetical protein
MANLLPDQLTTTINGLCLLYLRAPAQYWTDSATGPQFVFQPSLTSAEQATFDDLQTMAKFGVTMTLAEWQSIKADAAGLKTYLGVATPTAAQTAAATKAIIRVLAVIVRS